MILAGRYFDETKSRRVANYVAVAVAVSLPWSTSATNILMAVWLLAFLPTLDLAALRREILSPAGGFPILLIAWAALGMLWANTSWAESYSGLREFHKLACIPLLLAYFRRSTRGMQVMAGFFVSCIILLLLSIATALWPQFQWWHSQQIGVPVKNYITQNAEFAMSAFCFFYLAADAWKARAYKFAFVITLIALAFIADIVFVATARTELVVIAALIVLFGARRYGWKGTLMGVAALCVAAFVAWNTSSNLRSRIGNSVLEFQSYRPDGQITSSALHLEYLRKSIDMIAAAPLIGHGTGSIKPLFEQAAVGKTGVAGYAVTSNPHNQILAVAIPLGIIGVLILCAMWLVHVRMFLGPGLTAWMGLVIVTQNIVGSLFNSHLFDFVEAWIYVCGVSTLGAIRGRAINLPHPQEASYLKQVLWPQKS